MSVLQNEIQGRERVVFAVPESTAGVYAKPVATNALKVIGCEIKASSEPKKREDSKSTRSTLEFIESMVRGEWSISDAYLIASGVAGTAPNWAPILKAALGVQTPSGGTGGPHAWTVSDAQNPGTFTLVEGFGAEFMRAGLGCVVNELNIKASAGDEPKISASGMCLRVAETGRSVVLTADGTGTTFSITAVDESLIQLYSNIQVGADVGTNGLLVTAKNANALTVDTSFSWVTGEAVVPYLPTPSTSGAPIPGIYGGLTINPGSGAVDLGITEIGISLKNNFAEQDEAFEQFTSDFSIGDREVTVDLKVRARRDTLRYALNTVATTTSAISVTFGTGTGRRIRVELPAVRFKRTPIDIPTSEVGIISLSGWATGTEEIAIHHE